MKTKLLYQTNSYTYECSAKVVAVSGDEVALDATIFYPGGGGQMADRGLLSWDQGAGQAHVISISNRNGTVWHTLDHLPPRPETEVIESIDWNFRYRSMRTHSAFLLLCSVIWREFGIQVTGGQIYPDRARMDFALEYLEKDRITELQQQVNTLIAADYPIHTYMLPREKALSLSTLVRARINQLPPHLEEVRMVDFVGFDVQVDGGTLVNHTREIGGIQIIRSENKGRINKRLEIVLKEAL